MCISSENKVDNGTKLCEEKWPEDEGDNFFRVGNIYSRWTYSYMNKVLDKGSQQTRNDGTNLSEEDLFPVPTTMESDYLSSKFRQYYEEAKGKKNGILIAIWKVAAPDFIPAGFCQLVAVFAQVSIPLLVRELLNVLEANPRQQVVREGLVWGVLIYLASIINAFANQRHRHWATKAGIDIRAAIVGVVYDNALKMTPAGRLGLTAGEVTNLVATDTQKLFEVTQEGHLVWSCPLSMILVGIFLLLVMGPSTLVGMLVLFMFVPLIKRVASAMLNIRHKRAILTDKRIETVSAMLQGIRVTKLSNYESKYQERIEGIRKEELVMLRRELFIWATTLVMTVVSPVLATAATFATYVLVSESNILTASRTFTVLLLFSALRFPINYTGRLIGRAGQALEAARRIASFLKRETDDGDELDYSSNQKAQEQPVDGIVLKVQDANFVRGKVGATNSGMVSVASTGFRLFDASCEVKKGEILAVVGPVGAGKSTLVDGIIGEAVVEQGSVERFGRVAYASQVPFILNTTLRENILFGLPYDEERYENILDTCCLRPDIEQLGAAKDLTEIGERGITLSGGQKQRVSLARTAYAQADLVLCDDPLSALDAGTGKRVFDRLFRSSGPLANAGVVLVTHANHFLHRVDKIMVLVNGRMQFLGTWDELLSFSSTDHATLVAIESIRSSVQEDSGDEMDGDDHASSNDDSKNSKSTDITDIAKTTGDEKQGDLMAVETREHGFARLKVWLLWFKYAGSLSFLITQILLLGIDRFAYVSTEYWLTTWTEGSDSPVERFGLEFPAQTEGRSAQYEYLAVYASILFVSCFATFLRSEWGVTGGARCAKTVFSAMLASVLRAPMSYFETTPLGRILNRFTYDVEVVDMTLTEAMTILLIACGWFVAGVVVMSSILPWIVFALAPTMVCYVMLMIHYRKSGADLQRIDAMSRSPVQSMLAEGLDGSSTIKVFGQRTSFLSKYEVATDSNSSALLNFITSQRWLAVRIELMGATIILVATTIVVCANNMLRLGPGLVGMLVIWCSNFTVTLGFLMDHFSEAEAAITAIERVDAMARLPSEKAMETDKSITLSPSWPDRGALQFDKVCLRYREGLPLALNGLSFQIEPGQRCGVVGRTGAGKSTLSVALFRLVEIESGSITLDGIDVGTLGLSDVRSRLSIIPQDPFLFAGSLRECIDPFGLATDDDVLQAVQAVRLAPENTDAMVLERRVEEGGTNFSVGERQLICLARALLAKPKVLVMDEATASVDGETDAFIQKMLRTRFHETTLLTVAHRLNTIMDYDTILVMENGRAVEFGRPSELLDKNGIFADLVKSTGEESARVLREMATAKQRMHK